MRDLLRRFSRDQRGVSALEFAILAPVMITFYMGMAELTQALMADRRTAHVASAVGDLVTQSSQVSNADMTDIFSIAQTIIAPFPATTLKVRVSNVTMDTNGEAKVDWCDVSGMADLPDGSTVIVPAGLLSSGESIVISESSYTYDSPLDRFIPNGMTFNDKLYLKPRRSSKVMRTT